MRGFSGRSVLLACGIAWGVIVSVAVGFLCFKTNGVQAAGADSGDLLVWRNAEGASCIALGVDAETSRDGIVQRVSSGVASDLVLVRGEQRIALATGGSSHSGAPMLAIANGRSRIEVTVLEAGPRIVAYDRDGSVAWTIPNGR